MLCQKRQKSSEITVITIAHTHADTHKNVLTSHTDVSKMLSFKVFVKDFSRKFTKNEPFPRHFQGFSKKLYKK